MMKTHALNVYTVAVTGSLLLAGCAAQHPQYAYVTREKWPQPSNVHQYAGGEVLHQYQERGGIGTQAPADNAFGRP